MTNSVDRVRNSYQPGSYQLDLAPDFSEAPNPEKYEKSCRRLGRTANMLWDLQVIGLENIPMEGPGILAFTHRSYTEIFIQGAIIPRFMRAMMKNEVERPYYLGLDKYMSERGVFFVDRDGPDKRDAYETAYSAIEEGLLLDMNPEGTSKNRGPKLGELHKGVAALAVRAAKNGIDCPIVPIGMASEHLWLRLGRHLPVVIGQPFHAEVTGRSTRQTRLETHEKPEQRLQHVFDLALAIR